jgi:hypothetical protein
MPTASALGLPALVADDAPVDPVNARTTMHPTSNDCRLATRPEIIENRADVRSGDAGAALPAQDDVVLVDSERGSPGHRVDDVLEAIVAERLHLAAVPAHQMVVVVSVRLSCFVVRPTRAQLEPVNEPQLRERFEGAVHARDADTGTSLSDEVVDLLSG